MGPTTAKCLSLSFSSTVLMSQAPSATIWWVWALLYVTKPVRATYLCTDQHVWNPASWQQTHTHSATVGPKPVSTSWLSRHLARLSPFISPILVCALYTVAHRFSIPVLSDSPSCLHNCMIKRHQHRVLKTTCLSWVVVLLGNMPSRRGRLFCRRLHLQSRVTPLN